MLRFKGLQFQNNIKAIIGIALLLLVPTAGIILTKAPAIWPISALIYNVGLVYFFEGLSYKRFRLIAYCVVAAAFFIIESAFFFSYYIQNAGFNEAFFYHLRPDLFYAGIGEHLPALLFIVVCLFGFLILSSTNLTKTKSRKGWKSLLAMAFLAIGLGISPPARALFSYAENQLQEPENNIYAEFPELQDTSPSVSFLGSKRPNVVLIYAESLEQRYFDEEIFPGLLPNLKKLKKQSINFTNVEQGVGAGWTIAGMVASQCGYPLSASHDVGSNAFGMFDQFLPKASCIGDLLKKDGYQLSFIGGADARFAGKADFLNAHGFGEVIDREDLLGTIANKSYRNQWGIFDDTLFDFSFKKFRNLSKGKSPFLLTLLTLDTHAPDGFLSKSCGHYGKGNNSSLNSVHCSDHLISRFIEQVRNSSFSKDTVIILLSDHLAMRNQSSPFLEISKKPSRLTFFINMPNGYHKKNDNPGLQYDIAPTILDLLGYKVHGPIGFGAALSKGPGYLPGKFGEDKWEGHSSSMMAISNSLWDSDVTLNKKGISFSVSNLSFSMGGRKFDLHSEGFSNVPATTIFLFDNKSFKLEKIKSFPFGRELTPETIGQELIQNKEKLALVIGRAGNLKGFADTRNYPDQWVFFCGRPGSDYFSWGPVAGDLLIPFDLIEKLSQSEINDKVVRERKRLLRNIANFGNRKVGT